MNTLPGLDTAYMRLAFKVAEKSGDPDTKHGCVLVSERLNPDIVGWNMALVAHPQTSRPNKYGWFQHAEEMAVGELAAREGGYFGDLTAYITGHPCSRCFMLLVRAGVKRVVYGPRFSHSLTAKDQLIVRKVALENDISLEEYHHDGNIIFPGY